MDFRLTHYPVVRTVRMCPMRAYNPIVGAAVGCSQERMHREFTATL